MEAAHILAHFEMKLSLLTPGLMLKWKPESADTVHMLNLNPKKNRYDT